MRHIITVQPDGSAETFGGLELLTGLGQVQIRRLSHIWPAGFWKRQLFRWLRVLGDRGKVAEWTRSWRGPWTVRLANSPSTIIFTAQSRRVCLWWEKNHILS